jgi:hypothetical protein
MARTRAQENRKIRQDALREQLAGKGLVQKVIEDIGKIDQLAALKIDDFEDADLYIASVSAAKDKTQIIKVAIESRLKLVNKYLPDLKQTELVGDPDSPLNIHTSVSFVGVSSD